MPAQISDPSLSIIEVNVPDVKELTSEFRYNFYTRDERTTEFVPTSMTPLDKIPRYVRLEWTLPLLSLNDVGGSIKAPVPGTIKMNIDKTASEDSYVNPDYVSHTFSDVSAIENGSADMENYSRITNSSAESVFKMAKEQVEAIIKEGERKDEIFNSQVSTFAQTFNSLSNLPNNALGLRVFDKSGRTEDTSQFLRAVLNNVSLSVKVNKKVIVDVFKNSKMSSSKNNLDTLKSLYEESKKFVKNRKKTLINPVTVSDKYSSEDRNSVRLLGYIIDRYESTAEGLVKDKTFYLDGSQNSTYDDTTVLYGKTYFYSIRSVASVKVLAYAYDEETPVLAELFLASRPTTSAVECFEFVPPPEPEHINFIYDYSEKNLLIVWDPPTNPQRDIKQYQVLRRKSHLHPFELVAQYCFDDSDPGPGGSRYVTGEKVDGNKPDISPDLSYLVTQSKFPVLVHRDEDFFVDAEMSEASKYIYAICSVDAHGMVSNYSTQYEVTFDVYKNRLVSRVICDKGSPRPYPNMNMRMDVFKDALRISGNEQREMQVYFSPEYLNLTDAAGTIRKVVEVQTSDKSTDKPYYLMQLINLDNQKFQTLKLSIVDPDGLTVPK